MGRTYTYNPAIFDVADLTAAKEIILTPTDEDTETRWARETPYLAGLFGDALALGPDKTVIDYGCGVGRLAKALIERYGCSVVGVDISPRMLELAAGYVDSPRFRAVLRPALWEMAQSGFAADAALCVWVLQHCVRPQDDVGLIASALRPAGRLGLVNTRSRCVPTTEGWLDDLVDLGRLLGERFDTVEEGALDPAAVGERVPGVAYWGVYGLRS